VKHIALLRAVNLGSHNKIGMADLRQFFVRLGFGDAQTLLQSGNVVFSGGSKACAALEQTFEREARKQLELDTDFFVRTGREWQALVDANPFPKEAKSDPSHLVAVVVRDGIDSSAATALQQAISGRERLLAVGRCLYIVYPDGIGRSRLTTALMEKHIRTRGTARNWNTVLKLKTLVEAGL
jgi:uncharacterized protein (DUF1697 family)